MMGFWEYLFLQICVWSFFIALAWNRLIIPIANSCKDIWIDLLPLLWLIAIFSLVVGRYSHIWLRGIERKLKKYFCLCPKKFQFWRNTTLVLVVLITLASLFDARNCISRASRTLTERDYELVYKPSLRALEPSERASLMSLRNKAYKSWTICILVAGWYLNGKMPIEAERMRRAYEARTLTPSQLELIDAIINNEVEARMHENLRYDLEQ